MSSKLPKRVAVEMEMLHRLMGRHPDLIEKSRSVDPSLVEIDALAALLHSFYNGVENLFKLIAKEFDGGLPESPNWHTLLLFTMSHATNQRPAVISDTLAKLLKGYLDFRHVFRHAYSFELQWSRMAPLVWNVEETFRRLEQEATRFLSAVVEDG